MNETPTKEAQEEFYALYGEYAEASVRTGGLRTVYLRAGEELPTPGDLLEHLIVACRGEELWEGLIPEELIGDEAARQRHNERAIAIARHLSRQHKLDVFMGRPENDGKSFRIFSDEDIAGIFED